MKTESPNNIHKRGQAAIFRIKASLLQLKRGFENFLDSKTEQQKISGELKTAPVIAESKTPLWTESAEEEQFLLAGKVHNLRLVAKKINGLEIPAGEIFSFWKNVGQASRLKGFVVGRELREAVRGLDVKIITLGANIEDVDFWKDFDVEKGAENRLEKAGLVVLPAFVEHKPRRLLQAVSNKIPVIASKSCGLENVEGVETIEAGNAEDLRFAIESKYSRNQKNVKNHISQPAEIL